MICKALVLGLAASLLSCSYVSTNIGKEANTAIYYGGDIITMDGDRPEYVEAVVQTGGKIVYVGDKAGALAKYKG